MLASSVLVIGRDAKGYWLLELDPNNQAQLLHGHRLLHDWERHRRGVSRSGLMREHEPESQSLDHLKLVAYRTVATCIRVLGGSLDVGGEVHLYSSQNGAAFESETP